MQVSARYCNTMQNHAGPCITMQYHVEPCHALQNHAIPCNTMQCHAIPCNIMQYHAIPGNTMHYHISLITADGAYNCPVGSIWLFLSSRWLKMLNGGRLITFRSFWIKSTKAQEHNHKPKQKWDSNQVCLRRPSVFAHCRVGDVWRASQARSCVWELSAKKTQSVTLWFHH